MKTDLIIQQVVEKVRTEHNIVFRQMDDDRSKNFLDRYTAYAITNVRKILMKNLKRNAPLVSNSNGKRVKKKIITFDPTVHVKKEKQEHVTTMLNLELQSSESSVHDTSTLTMDKSRDDRSRIFESFVEYFNNGGKSLENKEDFLTVWKERVDEVRTPEMAIEEECTMPPLPGCEISDGIMDTAISNELLDEGNERRMEKEVAAEESGDRISTEHNGELEAERENEDNRNIEVTSDMEDEFEEYDGDDNCGKCELIFNNCSTHNQSSLLKEYGPGMKCVGTGCTKTLFECLNQVPMTVRGAFVCKHCSDRRCRQMKCTGCNFREESNGGSRRSRRNQN